MAPVVHGLEEKYSSQMIFSFLDIDDAATFEYKAALNYRYQPHLFLLNGDGELIRQWVGFASMEDLEKAIQDALFP